MVVSGSAWHSEVLTLHDVDDVAPYAADWNRLAMRAKTPFLTFEWLTAWWEAFGPGRPAWLVLQGADGRLRAGVCFQGIPHGLAGAVNDHAGDWDVVAGDALDRVEMWRAIAGSGSRRLVLPQLGEWTESAGVACEVLRSNGYSVVRERGPLSPYLPLPATWDALLASVSGNLRWQLRNRKRALEERGEFVVRTSSTESALDGDLEEMFRVEASGWKARSRTAILSDSRTQTLYRRFARRAARQGWLRLHILEVGGEPVAANYSCVFANRAFLLKTGFDERYAEFSPGFVLLGEALRLSIDEGLTSYEFLGEADIYKTRWTDQIRPRVTVRAYRSTHPEGIYWSRLRPRLKRARDRVLPDRPAR